jgi:hypothetical protein
VTDRPPGPDVDLSAIRNAVDDLGVGLAVWSYRLEPDARARRAASDAVDAIDAALAAFHRIRATLIGEIRVADDRTAARADELLAKTRDGPRPSHPQTGDRRRNQTSPEVKAPAEGIIRPGGDKSRAP